jgi:hypothetical protein
VYVSFEITNGSTNFLDKNIPKEHKKYRIVMLEWGQTKKLRKLRP